MEALIIHCHTIFDEHNPGGSITSSPPLPPAPLGETIPLHTYGSAHTKVSEYDPQQLNAPLPQTPTPQSTGDDFTPQLPARPPASIHPSSRGGTGSSNGHPNTSPVLSEAEAHVTSPTSYVPSPPLPLRPGRQGALTPIQSLRGTKGLDFSQPDVSEADWTGPAPASPPSSDPPSRPPSAYKSPQVPLPPPPSALLQSTFAPQQQQPSLTQTTTQEPQTTIQLPPSLPAVERAAVGKLEPIATPPEIPSNTKDDDHSTDYESPIAPNEPSGPALRPVASRVLPQQVPQVPVQATASLERGRPPATRSPPQAEGITQSGRESQDETSLSELQFH